MEEIRQVIEGMAIIRLGLAHILAFMAPKVLQENTFHYYF